MRFFGRMVSVPGCMRVMPSGASFTAATTPRLKGTRLTAASGVRVIAVFVCRAFAGIERVTIVPCGALMRIVPPWVPIVRVTALWAGFGTTLRTGSGCFAEALVGGATSAMQAKARAGRERDHGMGMGRRYMGLDKQPLGLSGRLRDRLPADWPEEREAAGARRSGDDGTVLEPRD